MTRSRTAKLSPSTGGPAAAERWRTLAEATAGDFVTTDGESVSACVAGALARLFGGAALVLDGVGDDAVMIVRGPAGGAPAAGIAASVVAMARAAAQEDRMLREEAAGDTILAAPLSGRTGPIGALAVRSTGLGGAEAAALLECFSAHAARALDAARAQPAALLMAEPSLDIVECERRNAIGDLAAGVAHHLNNLMTVALGNVQLVLRHRLSDRSTRSLTAVERAVMDAADVVRRLAASSGGPPLGVPAPLDLNALVDDTLALSRARWHDEALVRGMEIHARFERGRVPPVIADEGEVRELLLNLVLNAVDALDAGGALVVRTWADHDHVVCSVTDTGEGMTPEVRRRATEPFFSTRGPARRGLGLSVARGILERHHGVLAIESRRGEGTSVTFSLPASAEPPLEAPEAAASPAHGLRVLVVDDEDAVRTTIADLLAAAGHQALLASSGDEALTKLTAADGAVDLVLTDLGMPGLTGWDVIERVKAIWPELPVILVTGWGEHPRGGEGRHAPTAILAKPIMDTRLREVIAAAVEVTV